MGVGNDWPPVALNYSEIQIMNVVADAMHLQDGDMLDYYLDLNQFENGTLSMMFALMTVGNEEVQADLVNQRFVADNGTTFVPFEHFTKSKEDD